MLLRKGFLTAIGLFFAGGTPLLASPFEPSSVTKIYYLLASAKGVGQSSFGHAYLRISTHDKPSLDDDTIEFVAATQMTSFSDFVHAAGIGQPVKRGVNVEKYSAVLQEMNYVALRDLTSYELLLTSEQKSKIIAQVHRVVQAGPFGDYSFFTENCASATTEIFNSAGIPLGNGLSRAIPTEIPGLLERGGIEGRIYTDLNVRSRREKLFEKYEPVLKTYAPDVDSLRESLSAPEMDRRVFGFLRILKEAGRPIRHRYGTISNPSSTWSPESFGPI
jgi:hypothetical protein